MNTFKLTDASVLALLATDQKSKVEVHPTFNTAFYKILNAIGDICCLMWPIISFDLL